PLPGAHDLGTDPGIVLRDERVVDTTAPARLPPAGGEHPLVQPIPGVPEMGVGALALTGAVTIERNGEVVNTGEWHEYAPSRSVWVGVVIGSVVVAARA